MANVNLIVAQTGMFAFSQYTSLTPAYNPIQFVFEAGSTGSNATKAQLQLNLRPLTDFLDGQYFEINGRRYTARTVPQPGDIPAGFPAASQGELILQLLLEDPVISPNCNITGGFIAGGVYQINVAAKFPGSAFDFTLAIETLGQTPAAFSFVQTLAVNGNVAQAYSDWSVYVRLFVAKSGSIASNFVDYTNGAVAQFEQAAIIEMNYDQDNRMATPNLNDIISKYVQTYAPRIDDAFGMLIAPTVGFTAPEALTRFYIEYGEKYTPVNGLTPQRFKVGTIGLDETPPIGTPQQLWAINSALSQAHSPKRTNGATRAFMPLWYRRRISGAVNPVEVLTQSPNPKETTADSIELLYFVYYYEGVDRPGMALRYNVFYKNGSSSLNNFVKLGAFNRQTVWYAETGYRPLKKNFPNIDANLAIDYFDVAVFEYTINSNPATTGVQITYDKRYKFRGDQACLSYKRPQIIFLNPLGGYDTLYLFGLTARDVEAKRTSYEVDPKWVYQDTRKQYVSPQENNSSEGVFAFDEITNRKQTGIEATASYLLRTGAYPMDHIRWLQDSLFTSNKTYLMDWTDWDNAGNPNLRQLRQIVLDKPKGQTQVETDLYQLEFEAQLSLPIASIER